jgi:transposase
LIGLVPRAVRVYVATEPVSLRKSFDGLSNHVREVLAQDPLSGHVFCFVNRRRTQAKLLVWTRGGFSIVHKRLEQGTFSFLRQLTPGAVSVEVEMHELALLLEGIEVVASRASRRWEPPQHTRARRAS